MYYSFANGKATASGPMGSVTSPGWTTYPFSAGPPRFEEFQKVSALDPAYREVETKIQELQQGDFISMDTIKEDIEKEISFKSLEEGARIEREEKTKKNKK